MIDRGPARLIVGKLRDARIIHAEAMRVSTANSIERTEAWVALRHGSDVRCGGWTTRRAGFAIVETDRLLKM